MLHRTAGATLLGLTLASLCAAQTKQSLLFTNRFDSESLDSTATPVLLAIRGHDICAVTPDATATAFSYVPSTAFHARLGDADNNGSLTQLSGISPLNTAVSGPFVKWADKSKVDPRLLYWTVKETSATPAKLTVWAANKAHTMRPGDFVRFLDDGEVEFFITQDLVMKAAGSQNVGPAPNWVNGTTCICQDKDGNLYYGGPHGVSANTTVAEGHWVTNKPAPAPTFVLGGGVVMIPATAITYDAKGNVQDVAADSAVVMFNETGGGPNGEPSCRTLCTNSAALDLTGVPTVTTAYITGLDIDPKGGEFLGWDGKKHPNLMFQVLGALTSWKGTIYSTRDYNNLPGTIAEINGVLMGTRAGSATGSWLGLANGRVSASAPQMFGLCVVNTTWSPTAPYGATVGDAARDGVVKVGTDPSIDFAIQGPNVRFPVAALSLGVGVAKGGKLLGVDLSSLFGGYLSFYPPAAAWIVIPGGATDVKGQVAYTLPVPNDANLKGLNLLWQGVCLRIGGTPTLTNPFVVELQ